MSPLQPLRDDPALRRPAITFAVLVVTVLVGERLVRIAFDGFRQGVSGLPAWLPQFGSAGQTLVVYVTVFDLLKFVAIPLALVWLAYAYGRHGATGSA